MTLTGQLYSLTSCGIEDFYDVESSPLFRPTKVLLDDIQLTVLSGVLLSFLCSFGRDEQSSRPVLLGDSVFAAGFLSLTAANAVLGNYVAHNSN